MRGERLAGFPERPPSEVEWEDLLYRLELMPRALRVVLDELPEGEAGVRAVAGEMMAREAFVRRFLERAAGISDEEPCPPRDEPGAPAQDGNPFDGFRRTRARNFAIVQRRGIGVWGWTGPAEDGGVVTLFQVLSLLAREDANALARIRGPARAGRVEC